MVTNITIDELQNGQNKISSVDIELKEKQFMHDEFEYYKVLKTKLKRNAYADEKKPKSFR